MAVSARLTLGKHVCGALLDWSSPGRSRSHGGRSHFAFVQVFIEEFAAVRHLLATDLFLEQVTLLLAPFVTALAIDYARAATEITGEGIVRRRRGIEVDCPAAEPAPGPAML
jgi:hypothetical protein